ncbi:hypothetical protein [Bacteroides caccae]|uniref:hypothetical protein n=1 Tax=Bacteroides caccae TaxID=47678 RepID=UPI0012311687|nr:hypothetical protein F2Y49_23550 [Bacteroides caccae]
MRPNKSAPCKVPDSKKRRSIFPSLCFEMFPLPKPECRHFRAFGMEENKEEFVQMIFLQNRSLTPDSKSANEAP